MLWAAVLLAATAASVFANMTVTTTFGQLFDLEVYDEQTLLFTNDESISGRYPDAVMYVRDVDELVARSNAEADEDSTKRRFHRMPATALDQCRLQSCLFAVTRQKIDTSCLLIAAPPYAVDVFDARAETPQTFIQRYTTKPEEHIVDADKCEYVDDIAELRRLVSEQRPAVFRQAASDHIPDELTTTSFYRELDDVDRVHVKASPTGIFEHVEARALWDAHGDSLPPPRVTTQLSSVDQVLARPAGVELPLSDIIEHIIGERRHLNATLYMQYASTATLGDHFSSRVTPRHLLNMDVSELFDLELQLSTPPLTSTHHSPLLTSTHLHSPLLTFTGNFWVGKCRLTFLPTYLTYLPTYVLR